MVVREEDLMTLVQVTNGLLDMIERLMEFVDVEHEHEPPGLCRRCVDIATARGMVALDRSALTEFISQPAANGRLLGDYAAWQHDVVQREAP